MNIIRIPSDLLLSNMYVIEEGGHAIIVDPCVNRTVFKNHAVYDWIFLTHEHYDHISGVNLWKEMTGAKVLCSRKCAGRISSPKKNMSHYFDTFGEMQTWTRWDSGRQIEDYACEADEIFEGNFSTEWQGHEINLTECPGHSEGSILIHIDNRHLFSGDSIFKDFPTECRFPGGNQRRWRESESSIIRGLNQNLTVYPGHFEEFILKERHKETCLS